MRESIRRKLESELDTRGEGEFELLLITRGRDPHKGMYAFPGGFVDYGEDPKKACLRELKEECSVDGIEPKLITVAGDPDRDPRKHVITIVYAVQIHPHAHVEAGDDAATAKWYNLRQVWTDNSKYPLAFDHRAILGEFVRQYPKL